MIAKSPEGVQYTSPVYKGHPTVVDSLGAGDTFAAAVIHSLSQNFDDIAAAIKFGCLIAGDKVGYLGYDGVAEMYATLKA